MGQNDSTGAVEKEDEEGELVVMNESDDSLEGGSGGGGIAGIRRGETNCTNVHTPGGVLIWTSDHNGSRQVNNTCGK